MIEGWEDVAALCGLALVLGFLVAFGASLALLLLGIV